MAVVGGGVAGITAAHILQRRFEVTLLEGNDYLGGHTHTVAVPAGPDAGTPVDTGFIVFNDRTYPLFIRLLGQLGVGWRTTEMSFSLTTRPTGLCWAGNDLNGLFAQRRNLLRPSFLRMLAGIVRFSAEARAALAVGRDPARLPRRVPARRRLPGRRRARLRAADGGRDLVHPRGRGRHLPRRAVPALLRQPRAALAPGPPGVAHGRRAAAGRTSTPSGAASGGGS